MAAGRLVRRGLPGGEKSPLSLPTLLLAYLLFSAGLGVQTAHLRHLLRDPKPLFAGLAANLAIPLAFLVGISLLMGGWHNADHAGSLLVSLALIAPVPILTHSLVQQLVAGAADLVLGRAARGGALERATATA